MMKRYAIPLKTDKKLLEKKESLNNSQGGGADSVPNQCPASAPNGYRTDYGVIIMQDKNPMQQGTRYLGH
jgi:hypothetical protein